MSDPNLSAEERIAQLDAELRALRFELGAARDSFDEYRSQVDNDRQWLRAELQRLIDERPVATELSDLRQRVIEQGDKVYEFATCALLIEIALFIISGVYFADLYFNHWLVVVLGIAALVLIGSIYGIRHQLGFGLIKTASAKKLRILGGAPWGGCQLRRFELSDLTV